MGEVQKDDFLLASTDEKTYDVRPGTTVWIDAVEESVSVDVSVVSSWMGSSVNEGIGGSFASRAFQNSLGSVMKSNI
jgi:hypothetical protein